MPRAAAIAMVLLAASACSRSPPEPGPSPSAAPSASSSAAPPSPENAALTVDIQPMDVPIVRFCAAGAVDSARDRFFLWGGAGPPADAGARPEGTNPKLLDVVSMSGARRSTAPIGGAAPAGVFVPAMAHDPYGSALWVFGGWGNDKKAPSDALYRIDTAGEGYPSRPMPKSGPWPSARNGAAMATDSVGNALVLFGGDGGPRPGGPEFTPLDDLWRFDLEKQRWQRVEAGGDRPPARWHAAMAIDESARRAYVFGGAGLGPELDARMYELGLETSVWSLVRATGEAPPSLQGSTLTFDPEHHALVLVGGLRHAPPGPAVASEIWILDLERKRWSRVDGGVRVARRDHVAGYDTATRAHWVFGGRISQTHGDFYEVGEPVTGALRLRVRSAAENPSGGGAP